MKTINDSEQYNNFLKTLGTKKNDNVEPNTSVNIYFDALEKYIISRFYPRVLFALGIRAKTGGTIYQVNYGAKDEEEEYAPMFEKLKIKHYTVSCSTFLKGVAFLKAILLIFRHLPLEKLLKYKVRGVEIGTAMCDQIIRARGDLDTIERLKFNMFREVFGTIRLALSVDKQFKKVPPTYYLSQELGYNYKVIIDFVGKYGGKVTQVTAEGRIDDWVEPQTRPYYTNSSWKRSVVKALKEVDKTDYVSTVDDYFDNRRKGIASWGGTEALLAFSGKTIISRVDWLEKNNVDKTKKNICIMCHCMSDNSTTSEEGLYPDYYHWVVDTLRIISNIKNVNWILKAHPSRKLYGEGDRIYDTFRKYGTADNIYILDDYINSNIVFDLADAIVTVRGTAGLEYSSAGIPIIVAGKGFYDGFGFTIEPKTVKEYEEVLQNCDKIKPLSNEQILMAKKVSWAYINLYKAFDETDQILTQAIKTDFPYTGQTDIVFKKLIDLYNKGITFKDTYFYKAGYESV